METATTISPANEIVKKTFTIRVFGVGGAGCNAVNYLAREPVDGVRFTAINTDSQALSQSPVEDRLVIGAGSMCGLGAGGDPERGRAAAEEDHERIAGFCAGADLVLVVAGMGGGTGTGASPVVARLAKEKGALVLGVVFLPFDFEGRRRQEKADLGRMELQRVADGIICLPNQKLFKLVDEKTSVREAFAIANEVVAQGLRGIWRLLTRTGLINLDFADLCAATQGKHTESALATVETRGENRSRDLIDRFMAHPLIDGSQVLAEAGTLLVSIAGGPDLTMLEINRVMEHIHRHAEQAHILMGASIEEEWKERMALTVIISRKVDSIDSLESFPQAALPARSVAESSGRELDSHLVQPGSGPRPASRFVPPPPELTPERTDQLLHQQAGGTARQRKNANRLRQGQLPLEIVSKGRFEKSEPTLHQGQDLDVPTYIRRGVALN